MQWHLQAPAAFPDTLEHRTMLAHV